MILGITGGVGSGKSTVLDYLKTGYGAFLIECDEVARKLQQPGGECYEPMRRLFGDQACLNKDGTIDRKAVAQIVFSDEEKLKALNRIVHPAVKRRVRELIRNYCDSIGDSPHLAAERREGATPHLAAERSEGASPYLAAERSEGASHLVVIEAALLLEDNYGEICDEIWYVYADEHARRRRLKQSRGYSDDKITGMLANQRSDLSFRENCTVTIDNSSENLQNTFRQIDEALARRGVLKAVRR